MFVAAPNAAPPSDAFIYARPDDPSGHGGTWRDYLLRYNEAPAGNPQALLPAFELYEREIYRAITEKIGIGRTFILSAGWGLIAASFLTPAYDITFSTSAESWKRRRRRDEQRDMCMLPADTSDPIVFLGGKDYLPLFLRLTSHVRSPRTVFYNSANVPDAAGCHVVRFPTRTKTNWHYQCASALLKGEVVPHV
jgi:hypothetical protein